MWLGINTATGHLGLALWREEALVAELIVGVGLEHSETMFLSLEQIFALSGSNRTQLGGIGVAIGPGGFTGVRSGVSLALASALALNVPAFGITTLHAMAENHLQRGHVVASALDARRGLVYLGAWSGAGGVLLPERLVPLEEAIALLAALPAPSGGLPGTGPASGTGSGGSLGAGQGAGLVLVGEGIEAHAAAWRSAFPAAHLPGPEGHALRPSVVAALAWRRHAAGERPGPEELSPRYLREPKAVIDWEAAAARQGQGP